MPDINHLLTHQVSEGSLDVNLNIKIGDQQILDMIRVRKSDGTLIKDVSLVNLGRSDQIKGKSTFVTVIIHDSNPHTNWTSVTISLNNNASEKSYSAEVNENHGIVTYYIQIDHI